MKPHFLLTADVLAHDAGMAIKAHAHESGQLSVVLAGTMTVTVQHGWWLVPPGLAIWIPPGEIHAASYSESSSLINLKFDADFAARLPGHGMPLVVSDLLRELAHEAVRLSSKADMADMAEPLRLIAGLVVHQVRPPVDAPGLFVPNGRDRRLRQVIDLLRDNPGNNANIDVLAALAHTSSRTLARLFVEETQLTFGQWREHLRIVCAVDRLTRGQSITRTALELGYQSASSFTTLFTRLLGEPPRRYMRRWEQS
jgi:AraC-like DNA-binding protein